LGLGTLIKTGNMEAASNMASVESLGTAGLNAGRTGSFFDHAANIIDKIETGTELAQDIRDLAGLFKVKNACGK
jgi:hypothetical protein